MFLGKSLHISIANNGSTGASVISDRNYQLLSLNSSELFKYTVDLTLKGIQQNLKSVFFNLNLINDINFNNILKQIESENIDTVFIDTSLLGNIAEKIKNRFPRVYIIGFFHNVEYIYFKELIKVSKKLHHHFTLLLIKKSEKQLIKFSDVIITLNQRDSEGIYSIYKKKADLILPTSFVDNYDAEKFVLNKNKENVLNLLFVGSYFPPNVYGIDWFVNNVLNNIKREVNLYIVGNGFESHTFKNKNECIKLIGRVDDLSKYYYQGDLIIAPIFHGSGMKTKVAEALMYNKPVIGTKEAFEGYQNINDIGKQCDSAEEYINFIKNFNEDNFLNVRNVFLNNYNFDSINNNFCNFFNGRK